MFFELRTEPSAIFGGSPVWKLNIGLECSGGLASEIKFKPNPWSSSRVLVNRKRDLDTLKYPVPGVVMMVELPVRVRDRSM